MDSNFSKAFVWLNSLYIRFMIQVKDVYLLREHDE